jgi:hypothetical protein
MSESGEGPNWGTVIIGVLILAFAWYLHGVLTQMETSGGSLRINIIFALLYKVLGKWGAVGAIAFLGVAAVWVGISPPKSDDDD